MCLYAQRRSVQLLYIPHIPFLFRSFACIPTLQHCIHPGCSLLEHRQNHESELRPYYLQIGFLRATAKFCRD